MSLALATRLGAYVAYRMCLSTLKFAYLFTNGGRVRLEQKLDSFQRAIWVLLGLCRGQTLLNRNLSIG